MIETRLISNGKKVYLNEDNVEMIEPSNEFDTTKVYLVSGKAVICLLYTSPSPRD